MAVGFTSSLPTHCWESWLRWVQIAFLRTFMRSLACSSNTCEGTKKNPKKHSANVDNVLLKFFVESLKDLTSQVFTCSFIHSSLAFASVFTLCWYNLSASQMHTSVLRFNKAEESSSCTALLNLPDCNIKDEVFTLLPQGRGKHLHH